MLERIGRLQRPALCELMGGLLLVSLDAVRWQGFHTPIFMMLVPGATLGQTYSYSNALKQGSLWKVTLT